MKLNPPDDLLWLQTTSPKTTMWSPESSDQWIHPRVQMSFPSAWSSGPKHFTNVDLLLLNCLEPLDQRGSVESTRLRDDALIQVSAFYTWSSPQQRNEGPTSQTGEGRGGVLGTCWGRWWHTWAELTWTHLLHLFVHLLLRRSLVWVSSRLWDWNCHSKTEMKNKEQRFWG